MLAAALLLAAACTPSATYTPTPMIWWTLPPDADLAGHALYLCPPGSSTCTFVADIPCQRYDADDPPDGIAETRFCPGDDRNIPTPVQRLITVPGGQDRRFAMIAYDTAGLLSPASNKLTICFSKECKNTAATCPNGVCPGGPCN